MSSTLIYTLSPDFDRKVLDNVKGVSIQGDTAVFEGYNKAAAEAVLNGRQTADSVFQCKSIDISSERLELINQGVEAELIDAGKIGVKEILAANEILDRHNQQFTLGYLNIFRDQINTEPRPMILDHYGSKVATAYKAEVGPVPGKEGNWLKVKAHYVKDAHFKELGMPMKDAFGSTHLNYVSVGFMGAPTIKEVGDKVIGIFEAPEVANTGEGRQSAELLEISFITRQLGAQHGARVKGYQFKGAQAPVIKTKIITMIEKSLTIGDSTHQVKFTDTGVEGWDKLPAAIAKQAQALESARTTITAKDTEIEALEKEVKGLKDAEISAIKALYKELETPEIFQKGLTELEGLPIADLAKLNKSLREQHDDENPTNQVKGQKPGEPSENPLTY